MLLDIINVVVDLLHVFICVICVLRHSKAFVILFEKKLEWQGGCAHNYSILIGTSLPIVYLASWFENLEEGLRLLSEWPFTTS